MTPPHLTRRALGGAALLGASVPLLAACGSDEETSSSGGEKSADASGSPTGKGGASKPGAGGEVLVATGDVPVGGGVVLKDAELVVTQPSDGEFKCFTAICTHQGCVVGSVEDDQIKCPCHGSVFSASDGSVVNGPASSPLDEVDVSVSGGQVRLA